MAGLGSSKLTDPLSTGAIEFTNAAIIHIDKGLKSKIPLLMTKRLANKLFFDIKEFPKISDKWFCKSVIQSEVPAIYGSGA